VKASQETSKAAVNFEADSSLWSNPSDGTDTPRDRARSAVAAHREPQQRAPAGAAKLYAEDLNLGDCWLSELRVIEQDDVEQFAQLTGDNDPLHGRDGDDSPFGKPVVHGLLGLSVLAGLGTKHPNAATLALVGVDEWKFVAPVFFGDAVQAKNQIVDLQPHGRRAAKVHWKRQLLNESGRVVQEGIFVTLVAARAKRPAKPR
jgi:acyl dehydratase